MLKIKNQKKDPVVPPLTISALYNLSCFRHNKSVVVNQKEFDFTRRELKHDRKIMVKALLALGIKKGDVILMHYSMKALKTTTSPEEFLSLLLDYLGEINWDLYPDAKLWYAKLKSRPSFNSLLNDKLSGIMPSENYADLDF